MTDLDSYFGISYEMSLKERFKLIDTRIDREVKGLGIGEKDFKRTPLTDTILYKGDLITFDKSMGSVNSEAKYKELEGLVLLYNFRNRQYGEVLKRIRTEIKDPSYKNKNISILEENIDEEISRLNNLDIYVGGTYRSLFVFDDLLKTFFFVTSKNKVTFVPKPPKKEIMKKISFLLELIYMLYDINNTQKFKGISNLRNFKTSADNSIIEELIDLQSEKLQNTYGNTLLYSIIAKEYGYCVPYMLELEYTYNSKKTGSSICELKKEFMRSISADRVTCEIVHSEKVNDCEDKNQLITLYTKVNFPKRKHKGVSYEAYYDSHISILLVDSKSKSVEYYEPKGYSEFSLTCEECIKRWVTEKYPSFDLISTNTGEGLQCLTSEGSCFLINLLYFYLRVTNTEPIDESIAEVKILGLKDIVYKFSIFLEKLAEDRKLSSFVKSFRKYEDQMTRLSREEESVYDEEIKKVRSAYNRGDVEEGMKLMNESVFTSRRGFGDTKENSIIMSYLSSIEDEDLQKTDDSLLIKQAEELTGVKIHSPHLARRVLDYPSPYDFDKAVDDFLLPIVQKVLREKKIPDDQIQEALKRSIRKIPKEKNSVALYLESVLNERFKECKEEEDFGQESFRKLYIKGEGIYRDADNNCMSVSDLRGMLLRQKRSKNPFTGVNLWKNKEEFEKIIEILDDDEQAEARLIYFRPRLPDPINAALTKHIDVFNDIAMVGCILKADYKDDFEDSVRALAHLRSRIDSIPDEKERKIFLSLSLPESSTTIADVIKSCADKCIHGVGSDLIDIYLYLRKYLDTELLDAFKQTADDSVVLYPYVREGDIDVYLFLNKFPSSFVFGGNYVRYNNETKKWDQLNGYAEISRYLDSKTRDIVDKSLDVKDFIKRYANVTDYLEKIEEKEDKIVYLSKDVRTFFIDALGEVGIEILPEKEKGMTTVGNIEKMLSLVLDLYKIPPRVASEIVEEDPSKFRYIPLKYIRLLETVLSLAVELDYSDKDYNRTREKNYMKIIDSLEKKEVYIPSKKEYEEGPFNPFFFSIDKIPFLARMMSVSWDVSPSREKNLAVKRQTSILDKL